MIFFFANMWIEDFSRGITKKVFAQMKAMNELGYQVSNYSGYKNDCASVFDAYGKPVLVKAFPTKNKYIHRMIRNYYLKDVSKTFLRESKERFKIGYFRYLYFDKKTVTLFKEAKKQGLYVILEVHSYPIYFWGNYKFWIIYIVDKIYRKKALQYVDRIVALTDETVIWNKETINIENGVDLKSVKPQIKHSLPGVIRIISVSYEWAVHGYDRLIKGIYEYNKQENRKYRIEAIFVGTVLDSTKKLIKKLKMEDYVKLTGILQGDALDAIYNDSDIGMGCVAIHRKNTMTVSTIKTKEYIAKGIPFVYAGQPLEDEKNFPFSLQVKSGEEPLEMDLIIDFYEKMESIHDKGEKMREWAKKYTWKEQMKKAFIGLDDLF